MMPPRNYNIDEWCRSGGIGEDNLLALPVRTDGDGKSICVFCGRKVELYECKKTYTIPRHKKEI